MTLRITMAQLDMAWEDKAANLAKVEGILQKLTGNTDLVVLPEMFSTGFSMRSEALAEPNTGPTMSMVRKWARDCGTAICGSYIAETGGQYYNRGFFITPDSESYYDKRHLFRMGEELHHYSPGEKKLVVPFKGFNICLMVCYDLRFPVWARNVGNEYDLVIYVANWPESRIVAWNSLIQARAIENLAYACGVNRCGRDGMGLHYNGNSLLVDPKGKIRTHFLAGIEEVETITLSREELLAFREAFPAWKDADSFTINEY